MTDRIRRRKRSPVAGVQGLDDRSSGRPGEAAVSVPAAVGGVFTMIACIIGIAVAIIICTLHYLITERLYKGKPLEPPEPFIVSEYYARIEKAFLNILERQGPVDQTIILWWGLDGLRLTEDGKLEWVNRRKTKPVQGNVFYQPFQSIPAYNPDLLVQTQNTRASIDALRAQNISLQMQALQAQQTAQVVNSLQQCCVQYPAQYPPYFYGGCCGNYVG